MIREVTYRAVRGWARAAKREGSDIADSALTRWFTIDGVGCAGLQERKLRHYRVRGVYIDPAFRGFGRGTVLTEAVIEEALERGAIEVDAYTKRPGWYVARGFIESKAHPMTGVARVVWRKL